LKRKQLITINRTINMMFKIYRFEVYNEEVRFDKTNIK